MAPDVLQQNETVIDTLEEGDLVEFPGRIYSHWGVYIGGGEIVHLSGIDRSGTAADSSSSHVFTISGIGYEKACVKRENLCDVTGEGKVKKNNDKDTHNRPFCREDIKKRALSKIGPISYSVLWNNCEHFAAWCRNGVEKSQQADTALTRGMALGTVAVIGGIAYEAHTGGKYIRLLGRARPGVQVKTALTVAGVLGRAMVVGWLAYKLYVHRDELERIIRNCSSWFSKEYVHYSRNLISQ